MQFALGFLLAITLAIAARGVRSLTTGGAVAATLLGTVVYGFGGWQAAVVLIAFFIGSSLMGRLVNPRGTQAAAGYAKGEQRDAGQVFANGLVAVFLAVAIALRPADAWAWCGYAGAVAAVTADTWATELGPLSSTPPRLILDLRKRVRTGTSGGVTLLGTSAAALAAALIAGLSALVAPGGNASWLGPITVAGFAGSLVDSLLGATLQAMYRCTADGQETEQHPLHRCGARTLQIRGWSWMNNDRVNLICAMFGALGGVALGVLTG